MIYVNLRLRVSNTNDYKSGLTPVINEASQDVGYTAFKQKALVVFEETPVYSIYNANYFKLSFLYLTGILIYIIYFLSNQ